MKARTAAFLAAGILALSGCGTPKPALDQANHGAALTAALHQELRNFREKQLMVASSRAETIKQIERSIAEFESATALDDRLARAAGRDSASALYQTITGLADSIATDEAAQQKRLAELHDRLIKLAQPLPENAAKLAAVQKAMAALGSELSPAERTKLVTGFVSEVKSEIDKAKEAADKKAKEPPVQSAGTK